jgi:hypothetical protein
VKTPRQKQFRVAVLLQSKSDEKNIYIRSSSTLHWTHFTGRNNQLPDERKGWSLQPSSWRQMGHMQQFNHSREPVLGKRKQIIPWNLSSCPSGEKGGRFPRKRYLRQVTDHRTRENENLTTPYASTVLKDHLAVGRKPDHRKQNPKRLRLK